MDLTETQRGMYDAESWAVVARLAGLEPYHTEAQARRVARAVADLLPEAFAAGWDAHRESVGTATTDIPFQHWLDTYLDEALSEENK